MKISRYPILIDAAGEKMMLIGNDAFVRGMIGAEVEVAAAYPRYEVKNCIYGNSIKN